VGGALTQLGHATDSGPRSPDDFITPDTESAIQRGLDFLAGCQAQDGSFGDRANSGNAAVTSLAALALLSGGHHPGRGKYGKVVARAADYIVARGRASTPIGYLQNSTDLAGHGSMYQHGFSALFLSEIHGTFPDPVRQAKARDMLEKAVALTVKGQNKHGGWRYEPRVTVDDVSVTVAQLMALRAAKNAGIFIDKSVVDKAVEYIKACQLSDGGFCYIKGQPGSGSLFPRSAAAIVGLYSAGIYDGPEIQKGLKYLMRYLPTGQRVNTFDIRREHYLYGHYYAALAMWTAGGNYWAEWFPAIRNELLIQRDAGGVWTTDFFGAAYATAMACIILQLPNNYLPIMQK
jgi:hypothetical protein